MSRFAFADYTPVDKSNYPYLHAVFD